MLMTYIPLVYFGLLSILLYKRHHQVDIATIVAIIFAISGLFSVLIDINNLRSFETRNYEISFFSASLYCLLLTICIVPISNCDVINRSYIKPVGNVKLLKVLSLISVLWLISTVILGWNIFALVLSSDMADIRNGIYAGIQLSWMDTLPGPIRMVFSSLNMLFGCPWVLLFLGFYSMIGYRVPLIYSYGFILASLSGPFNGIIGADRSATAYWILAACTLFILFRKQIPQKAKKQLLIIGFVILGALIAYLSAMTISRFGESESDGGSLGSLVSYFGQSYINFCYFYDNYDLPHHHFGIVFPFISEYIFGVPSGGVAIQEQMSFLSRMSTGVFYTFIGQMIIGIGQSWAVILTLLYALISNQTLRRINKRQTIDIQSQYLFFAFASVVLLGIFVHYYASASKTFSLFVMYFVIKMLR